MVPCVTLEGGRQEQGKEINTYSPYGMKTGAQKFVLLNRINTI
jgi:hypothetical protein